MANTEQLNMAAEIILENLLTPIIYVYVDEAVEFIVFCDLNARDEGVLRRVEELIYINVGIKSELVDIREFDESDRARIAAEAEVLYAESDFMLNIFKYATKEDIKKQHEIKQLAIERKNKTGSYYEI